MSNPPEINPYASPQKFDELPSGPQRPIGVALPWRPTEAIRFGWDAVLRQPLVLLAWWGGMLIGSAPSLAGNIAQVGLQAQGEEKLGWIVYSICVLLGLLLTIWMHMGLLRYTIKLARGHGPQFGEIFSGGPFFSMLGAGLLASVGVSAGMFLLVVPGLILAFGWLYASYLVVDRRLGAIQSISASWRATKGHKGTLFLLALLCFVVAMLGMLAFCVGYLVAMPICMIAFTYVYLKLTGEEPVLPPKLS